MNGADYGRMRQFPQRGYDVALICLNGHVITSIFGTQPERGSKHCDECGAATISTCPSCKTEIRGVYRTLRPDVRGYSKPGYCHECGKPYPWTEASLQAAKDLTDEVDGLTTEQKELLKKSLGDLVRDTPRTSMAVVQFKKFMGKVGSAAAKAFQKILIEIATDAVKKQLGL